MNDENNIVVVEKKGLSKPAKIGIVAAVAGVAALAIGAVIKHVRKTEEEYYAEDCESEE